MYDFIRARPKDVLEFHADKDTLPRAFAISHVDFGEIIGEIIQGCPLSPVLFDIFINDLPDFLPNGVRVPGLPRTSPKVSALLFADDSAILMETPDEMRKAGISVAVWFKNNGLECNVPKSAVLMTGAHSALAHVNALRGIRIGRELVPVVNSYKYLGFPFHRTLDMSACIAERLHGLTGCAASARTSSRFREIHLIAFCPI
jgi:hypothetical protein